MLLHLGLISTVNSSAFLPLKKYNPINLFNNRTKEYALI